MFCSGSVSASTHCKVGATLCPRALRGVRKHVYVVVHPCIQVSLSMVACMLMMVQLVLNRSR
jgi:hypothetical protein